MWGQRSTATVSAQTLQAGQGTQERVQRGAATPKAGPEGGREWVPAPPLGPADHPGPVFWSGAAGRAGALLTNRAQPRPSHAPLNTGHHSERAGEGGQKCAIARWGPRGWAGRRAGRGISHVGPAEHCHGFRPNFAGGPGDPREGAARSCHPKSRPRGGREWMPALSLGPAHPGPAFVPSVAPPPRLAWLYTAQRNTKPLPDERGCRSERLTQATWLRALKRVGFLARPPPTRRGKAMLPTAIFLAAASLTRSAMSCTAALPKPTCWPSGMSAVGSALKIVAVATRWRSLAPFPPLPPPPPLTPPLAAPPLLPPPLPLLLPPPLLLLPPSPRM